MSDDIVSCVGCGSDIRPASHCPVCASENSGAVANIPQQAQPKITPHCGVCFWFPSATCEKCTEYSHFVEDPA